MFGVLEWIEAFMGIYPWFPTGSEQSVQSGLRLFSFHGLYHFLFMVFKKPWPSVCRVFGVLSEG